MTPRCIQRIFFMTLLAVLSSTLLSAQNESGSIKRARSQIHRVRSCPAQR